MFPYEQGGLDSLCGIYSIINASKIINAYDDDECKYLFEKIVRFLDSERSLSKLLINGIDINLLGQVMNNVSELRIVKEQPYHGKPETTLAVFWNSMQKFLEEPNRTIILGLGGKYDHWTVLESITDKQIKLFDSDKLKLLNRSSCTTSEPDNKRKHQLFPTHTYFLRSINE